MSPGRRPAPLSLSQRLLAGSALGLAISCGGFSSVHAQEQPAVAADAEAGAEAEAAGAGEAVSLPTISVPGDRGDDYKAETVQSPKYTQPILDIPQTITVIPQEVMLERNATTLRDVLRTTPGISVVAGEGGGVQGDNFNIRGFSANTDMYIDGVRDIAQYARDPFNLEQVEVSKGPASAYGGRGTTGGSINQVTKAARLDPFVAGTLTGGTNMTRRVTADVNQPLTGLGLDGAAFRLNVLAHESDVAERDVTEEKRWGFAPSLGFGLNGPTRVHLDYYYLEQDNIPDYGLPAIGGVLVPGLDRTNWYGFKFLNTEETSTHVATAEIEHDFSDSLTIRNLTRYTYSNRFSIVTPPRAPNIAANTVNNNPTGRDRDETLLANQTDVTASFDTGAIGHDLVAGLELSRETLDHQAIGIAGAPANNLFNPNPSTTFTPVFTFGNRQEATGDTVAVYMFDTLTFGSQWELSGGVRFDHFDTEFTQSNGGVVTADLARTDETVSWRVGGVYKPAPNGSVYLAYGTSFNPAAQGLNLSTNVTNAATPNLEPEENRTLEFGTKWEVFDRRLALNAALFRIVKTNARTQDPVDPTDVLVLEGRQRVQGFEFGAAGGITPDWEVFGGYTFLDGTILESRNAAEIGNDIGRTPRHTFNLWTTHALPYDFEVGFGVQYVSEMAISNTNQVDLEGYVLFDAMLSYEVMPGLDLRLNAYNLANEFYIDKAHGGGAHQVPGPGRTLLLSSSFIF